MKDRGQVIVLCMFGKTVRADRRSVDLSVESEHNYTVEESFCFRYDNMHQFEVTVSPPVSFTCVYELHLNGEVKGLRSETYTYGQCGKSVVKSCVQDIWKFHFKLRLSFEILVSHNCTHNEMKAQYYGSMQCQ